MLHQLGTSLQNLVTSGGSVLPGLSLRCGRCGATCLVWMQLGGMTTQEHLPEKYFCPYCGAEGQPALSGRIRDTRPIGDD